MISPVLMERYLSVADKVLRDSAKSASDNSPLLTADKPPAGREADAAARNQMLEMSGFQAFRRPLTAREKQQYAALFHKMRESCDFDAARLAVAEAILVSPSFLFRIEQTQPDRGIERISGWELASRLSCTPWPSVYHEFIVHETGLVIAAVVDRPRRRPR
jgi:hypothetical protein